MAQYNDGSNSYSSPATYGDVYPEISYGEDGAKCVRDTECKDGLVCELDLNVGGRYCHLPQAIDYQCSRSKQDQSCHKFTRNGHRILCKDSSCPPIIEVKPTPFTADELDNASMYLHAPSGNGFCIAIHRDTGFPEAVDERYCKGNMMYDGDLDDDYRRFALSPQYTGVFR